MCGILAVLADGVERERVVAAANLMVHRGPDDAGLYLGEGVALAARRLSIIDLAGGKQPLANEDRTVWVTCNGEVVNAPALQQQLRAAGHHFRSRSDTEILVHAYEQWGIEMVSRLRGMFAFALWDSRRRLLFLVRDRLGIKPLYYSWAGNRFACASEIRPLLTALPRLVPRADTVALSSLFEVGFIPSPRTAFAGISQLPAGHLMVVQGGQSTLRRYWQPDFAAEGVRPRLPLPEAVKAFRQALQQTVDRWRLSDVPVGSLLSGGVDSGALAALLTEANGGPIHTFNIAFTAASHDEAERARQTAGLLGSHHHELVFDETDFDILPEVVRHLEVPQCSATSVPLYLLYRGCHEAGFKVILTGEGADELLAGYPWFDGDRRLRPWLRLPQPFRLLLALAPLPVSAAGRRALAQGGREPVARYLLWHQTSAASLRRALLALEPAPSVIGQWWASHAEALRQLPPLHQFQYLESQTRLVDFINLEVDRMSMAHSVEARPPFLDHELWEHVARLPPAYKLSATRNKLLLREAMAPSLPSSVRYRPKRGLATPHAAWWRRERLPPWAEEALHPAALAATGYFREATVRRLRQQHRAGRADHSRVLMGVLTTQLWYDAMSVEV